MESALSATPFSIPKTLNLPSPNPKSPLFTPIASLSYPSPLRISSSSSTKRSHRRLQCLGSSAGGGSFGGDDGSSGGGGGGGDGTGGGDSEAKLGVGAADESSVLSSDVIILNVGGMTCGGCASNVKKILESQPQVASASVDLATETAMVWPVLEAKATPNWQNELGEALAKHLTTCGFKSNLRVAVEEAVEGAVSP
ncbi:hypothetical protein V6N13_149433 [Hibiscus sabdariffa]|uniref:HMA domain-containing protein n=1 Tax=Hibiscus sabdariffa TaxID=183260 RepID=A0ABR2EHB9_9ROSI